MSNSTIQHQLDIVTLKQGDSVDHLLQTLQHQNEKRYYYTMEGEIHWRNSLKEVAEQIQEFDTPESLPNNNGWYVMCQAIWGGRSTAMVEMKIYSQELHDYLVKNLVVHNVALEEETRKKQSKDLQNLHLVIYPRTKDGFGPSYTVVEKLIDITDAIKFYEVMTSTDIYIDVVGTYRNKNAWIVISHPTWIKLATEKHPKQNETK